MPWRTGDFTDDEWTEILKYMNTRNRAMKDAVQRQKRQAQQRRR